MCQSSQNIIEVDYSDTIINVGKNELNINKIDLIEKIKRTVKPDLQYELINSEDSRSYKVDFSNLQSKLHFNHITFEQGIRELMDDDKINCSLEDWDTVFDYYRPNGSSKSWYLRETGKFDFPKSWGVWNLFDIENQNKVWDDNVLRENILVNYGDNVNYVDKINAKNKKHLYLINVYDNNFFRKNKDIGFKCISENYLDDVRKGKSKIVMIHQFEGVS